MKNFLQVIISFALLLFIDSLQAQVAPAIEWDKSHGGSAIDEAYSIQQTDDAGYIVAGYTFSDGGNVSGNHGLSDYWIVKLGASGNIEWQKCLGGSSLEVASSVQQTTDGGFIVAGTSQSNDGDVSGNHITSYGEISGDYWIVKLNSSGYIEWQKCFGGSDYDEAHSIQETTDGGYIVAGFTYSNDGDVSGNHLTSYGDILGDYWIVKLTSSGSIEWQKCLGGTGYETASSVQQTTDGGFIIAGFSTSDDGDVSGNHGSDFWIVKLNALGSIAWQKCFGGSYGEEPRSIEQTTDGGFIVAGNTGSSLNDGDVSGFHPGFNDGDEWVVKLDTGGNLVWQKCLGGSGDEVANSVRQTNDGGYIIAGSSTSDDGDASGNHGSGDYWVVKIDAYGNLIWQKCLGGSAGDFAYSIQQTTDGGFIVAGNSASDDGDITFHHAYIDEWIVKLSGDQSGISSPSTNSISLFPNPVQNQLNINLATPADLVTICVYDLQGRMIALPMTFENMQAQLNTTALPDGFYALQIVNIKTGMVQMSKFIKE